MAVGQPFEDAVEHEPVLELSGRPAVWTLEDAEKIHESLLDIQAFHTRRKEGQR